MVIALAGRRIDAEGAEIRRFPLQNVDTVEQRLHVFLERNGSTTLVSSAACGADLLAQAAAGLLGIRRLVILPFERDRFRETSVTDRPGDWGQAYERLLD